MVLTISPEHLRVDIVLRMYSIAPAGVDARGNTHWVKIQEKKSLTEVSARYIGAILVGETTSWVNSEAMLLEWMDENGGANNIDIRTRVSANSDIIIHEIHGHTVFFCQRIGIMVNGSVIWWARCLRLSTTWWIPCCQKTG